MNTNQRRAIEALLSEATIRDAAEKAGLGETTLYRYLADPNFKAELRKRQNEALAAVTASLVGMSEKAVRVLRDVLDDPEIPPTAKVRAALGWLKEKREAVELGDLVDRVAALEQVLIDAANE